ncbi:hypothetical protein ACP275_13G201400 [Erythranthe tilingii]
MQSSSNDWAQDMFMPELGFDDDDDEPFPAAIINTGEAASQVVIGGDKSLGPKVLPKLGSVVGKPMIRRRSRASRKSPATLLNANASNFRALVQQFTGCHSSSSTSSPLSPFGMTTTNYKGPINLNFSQNKSCNLGRWSVAAASSDQQVDQQSFFSFTTTNNINIDAVTTTTTTTTTTSGELLHHVSTVDNYDHHPLTLDDFDLENLSLHQLSGPADYSALPAPGTRNDPVFWGYN